MRVLRTDPESGARPHYQQFEVPLSPDSSVLDLLLYLEDKKDVGLSVNHSCGKQRCGSCAMKIDGKVRLACYTPAGRSHSVAPLPGFRVIKDLIVDWKPYEDRLYALLPDRSMGTDIRPREPSAKDVALSESAMTCIKCFACVGVCPTVEFSNPNGFAGPAISVMLTSFLDDPRKSGSLADQALKAGLEFCTKCYACNSVCPADIDIVASINRLQKETGEAGEIGKHLNEMLQGYL